MGSEASVSQSAGSGGARASPTPNPKGETWAEIDHVLVYKVTVFSWALGHFSPEEEVRCCLAKSRVIRKSSETSSMIGENSVGYVISYNNIAIFEPHFQAVITTF